MRHVTKFLALLLSFSVLAYSQGNTFTKVRYNGGSVASKVDPKDWDNELTVMRSRRLCGAPDIPSISWPRRRTVRAPWIWEKVEVEAEATRGINAGAER